MRIHKRWAFLPPLLLGAVFLAAGPDLKSVVIPSGDDSYVVTDLSTTDDPQGYRARNFGAQDSLLVSFDNKAVKDEQVVALSLAKFDLNSIKDKQLQSATLQMYALQVSLTQAARLVDATLVDGIWNQKNITYNNRPQWGVDALATSAVYGAGVWYSWDVTQGVTQRLRDGQISLVLAMRTAADKAVEQVVFASQESGVFGPRLTVVYAEPVGSSGTRWWPWAAGIGGAALVAFGIGWRISVRRRRASDEATPAA